MAFNKMFVMLPVMFAARKLDGEDPMVVYYLRIAYAVCQSLCVVAVLYTYFRANSASAKYPDRIIYVPPAPTVRVLICLCVLIVSPLQCVLGLVVSSVDKGLAAANFWCLPVYLNLELTCRSNSRCICLSIDSF